MTHLTVTVDAAADTDNILSYLVREVGHDTAERYAQQFRATIGRLLDWPESGAPRPQLGEAVRIVVISPYVLIYEYRPTDDTLALLRSSMVDATSLSNCSDVDDRSDIASTAY